MGKLALGCLGILLLVVVIAAISFAGTYNRLVTLGQDVDKQWSEVENQYQRRADLIPNLVQTVQGAANFEKETLTAVTEARASVGRATITPGKAPTDPETLARYQAAQDQLGSALQRLLVVSERYPELRANQNFRDLQAQLEGTENRITVARGRFNDSAQQYNTVLKRFPTNFIGGMFGFKERPYFKATTPGAEQAPKVNFNFGSAAPTAAPAPAK
ncbi:MAG TPA: LemA family protein [Thermoanaerobaculia bacterium]|jgi:LemA protein|nr:LemA family protein [Thermoanaerobaculia bacterium]